jgi:hypothetical protein
MLLVAAVLVLVLPGCARKAPPLPPPVVPVYPYSTDVAKAFYATASGLSEMAFQGEAEAELPASKAPNASILSSDGKAIVVAVNGWGVERIEVSPDSQAYRLVDSPLPAQFPGLCTGGAWYTGSGFLVQLFRDPFGDPPPSVAAESGAGAERVPASRLVFFDGSGGAATTPNPFPRDLDPGFELFALLPAGGTWFAELRKDAAERVDLKFFAVGDPLSLSGPVREIRRAEFEAALTPLPFSSLAGETKAALGSALRLLGKGPWLARVRSGAGEDRWYLSSGKAEEAAPVFAWTYTEGAATKVLALSPDGKMARSEGLGEATVTSLTAPVEGAGFTALAVAGNLAAAAWEAGDFPFISSAGIVLAPVR